MGPMLPPDLAGRIAAIELLVLDVDGVLTDGRIVYSDNGVETKTFHVHDGAGVRFWLDAGRQAAIISGRQSPAVARRARELGIPHVIQGAGAKLPALQTLLRQIGLGPDQACVVGDDLPDLPLLRNAGLGVAVADACPELRLAAHYVTSRPGGRGAVREVVELLLAGQGQWQPLLDRLNAERI
jgi:3-deoxy-D-manno-octulosonate 8-phosphate phosphatase (KDO 8-P phosphatase)